MDIKSAVQFILDIENLRSDQDLKIWCGDMKLKKLYSYVQNLAPENWERVQTPETSVRANFQRMLSGYGQYNKITHPLW